MSSYGAGQWMRDMALLRISPDTRIVADHLHPIGCPCDEPGERHPKGCTCPECSELRAAVGKGMDKHIAATMAAKEAGRRVAEQEITAQQKREAAARAEVTRELAGYGAYPYRDSGRQRQQDAKHANEAVARHLSRLEGPRQYKGQDNDPHAPCTCRDPKPGTSGVQDRPYAHDRACRRNHGQFSGTPGWRADHGKLIRGIEVPSLDGAVTIIEAAPPADPVAQWWEVTRSLVLPDFGQFAAQFPDQPPGTCANCRTGPLFAGNRCWYCNALTDLAGTVHRQPRRERADWFIAVLLVVLVFVVAVLTMYVGLT